MASTFRDLLAWQQAHTLVLEIYTTTRAFPVEEKFGLTSQLRSASVSVPANIAEGYKRRSKRDYLHFLNMADCSLEETKYYIWLCKDLGYLQEAHFGKLAELSDRVGRLLGGLQKSVEVVQSRRPTP